MKRFILILGLSLSVLAALGQDAGELVDKCALNAGENTTYLKDYIIKLPAVPDNPPVHKESMYLMKNAKYRFTLCSSEKYSGELIISLIDKNKVIISSYNADTGKTYASLDFECRKTGIYQLQYSFKDGARGLGVGVISMIR